MIFMIDSGALTLRGKIKLIEEDKGWNSQLSEYGSFDIWFGEQSGEKHDRADSGLSFKPCTGSD